MPATTDRYEVLDERGQPLRLTLIYDSHWDADEPDFDRWADDGGRVPDDVA